MCRCGQKEMSRDGTESLQADKPSVGCKVKYLYLLSISRSQSIFFSWSQCNSRVPSPSFELLTAAFAVVLFQTEHMYHFSLILYLNHGLCVCMCVCIFLTCLHCAAEKEKYKKSFRSKGSFHCRLATLTYDWGTKKLLKEATT